MASIEEMSARAGKYLDKNSNVKYDEDDIQNTLDTIGGLQKSDETIQDIIDKINLIGPNNIDEGTANSGTTTSLTDDSKNWTTDIWAGAYINVIVNSTTYTREIDSNTSDTISWIDALDSAVSVNDEYEIKLIADTVSVINRTAGEEGNAWNNEATGASGNSSAIDTQYVSVVDIAGTVDGATDLTLYKSQDGTNFYDSGIVIEITSAEDFAVNNLHVGFRYLRLQSSNNVTATATIAAKM